MIYRYLSGWLHSYNFHIANEVSPNYMVKIDPADTRRNNDAIITSLLRHVLAVGRYLTVAKHRHP